MSRKIMVSVGLTALVALAGCGGQEVAEPASQPSSSASTAVTSAASTASSGTSAPTPSDESTSESPEATSSPTMSQESSASSPSSELPTAQPQVVASPGTNCGVADSGSSLANVYVFGGQVSCDEALETVRTFLPSMTDDIGAQGAGSLAFGDYTCQESDRTSRETGTYATCTNPVNHAYIQLRTGVEPIPGLVADASTYSVSGLSGVSYSFTPAGSALGTFGCSTLGGLDVTCEIIQRNPAAPGYAKTWKVSMDPVKGVVAEEGGAQGPTVHMAAAKPLDIGTTINFIGFSCQADSAESIRCIGGGEGNSFTISPDGVTHP